MERAWPERALTFHRLGVGAELGLQEVHSGFPLSAVAGNGCVHVYVCAYVCERAEKLLH